MQMAEVAVSAPVKMEEAALYVGKGNTRYKGGKQQTNMPWDRYRQSYGDNKNRPDEKEEHNGDRRFQQYNKRPSGKCYNCG